MLSIEETNIMIETHHHIFLINATTHILTPKWPATVITSNFKLPTHEIVTEGIDINGFIIHNYVLHVKSFEVANTRCDINLCGRQNDNSLNCPCFQMTSHSGNVVVSILKRKLKIQMV